MPLIYAMVKIDMPVKPNLAQLHFGKEKQFNTTRCMVVMMMM